MALLLAISWPFTASPATAHAVRERQGAWTLTVSRNSFTQGVSCALKGHAMEVQGGAVIFHFAQSMDTSEAWIRIGARPAEPWRPMIPELRQMGVRLRFDDLANPSQGRVAVPLDRLAAADAVWIAPSPRGRPRRFMITGLNGALARAKAQDCGFEDPTASGAAAQPSSHPAP
jgi:hypothetical protein